MSNAVEILRKLGIKPLRVAYEQTTDIVKRLEAEISYALPTAYAECLSAFNTTSGFNLEVTFPALEPSPWSVNGKGRLKIWYANDDMGRNIWAARKTFLSQLPEGLLVIGEASGGNPICLDFRVSSVPVLFWDHEGPQLGDEEASNLYKIAPDFSSFVSSLIASVDDKPPVMPQGMKVKGWSSPELKAKAEEFLRRQRE